MKLRLKKNYKIQKVSEWAEANRVLPASVTALSGKFSYDYTPYLKEIADCLSVGSGINEVAIMKGSQIGATTGILENFMGYTMSSNPGPSMYVTSTKDTAEEMFANRFMPMIELSGLKDKLIVENNLHTDKKNKKQAAKKDIITFAGGFILARGLNSAPGLKSHSIKNLVVDEIDEGVVDLKNQGDPVELAAQRTKAMGGAKKILYISTPTVKGISRIERYYKKGDCRKYHLPCPDCDHKQHLQFDNLKYNVDDKGKLIEESVGYQCEGCGVLIDSKEKKRMVAKGEWIPTKKSEEKDYRSYHLNSMYAPEAQYSWVKMIKEYLTSKDVKVLYKSFVNNALGETWQELENGIKGLSKWSNKLEYKLGEVPEGVCFITTATDVQRNGLYVEVLGWGYNRQSWLVDFMFLEGDTSDLDNEVWQQHEQIITKEYSHKLISLCNFIDSGDQTNIIYDYCRSYDESVYPIKGQQKITGDKPFRGAIIETKNMYLIHVNTYHYKDNLYSFLKKKLKTDRAPVGFCNFAKDTTPEYFTMLESERKVQITKGNDVIGYEYRGSRNNHALDTRIYNMAAADYFMSQVRKHDDQEYEWNEVCEMFDPMLENT